MSSSGPSQQPNGRGIDDQIFLSGLTILPLRWCDHPSARPRHHQDMAQVQHHCHSRQRWMFSKLSAPIQNTQLCPDPTHARRAAFERYNSARAAPTPPDSGQTRIPTGSVDVASQFDALRPRAQILAGIFGWATIQPRHPSDRASLWPEPNEQALGIKGPAE